ncbi:universal stress protein [Halomonas alkalisoli]|uniref:universal stress protein n=1 Tax=Halomonas alkalisoli TaxID=2907158 RepID=UPI001F2BD426|nr:universal stress protein [Halomonas alkalisoli]MCE9681010.1 universal stress protein [Halomonas alkalisoli]
MMKPDTPPPGNDGTILEIARVLALLDASRHSLAALAAAVNLASSRQAELVAVYVEDLDLLSCAAFPFSCEIGAQSGVTRPLTVDTLEATIARQLQRVHQALERAVAGRELRHRLEVSRGPVAGEALAKAGPEDVLVLGKAGTTERWGTRLGSTSRRLILEAPCTVLLWDERHPFRRGPLRMLSREQSSGAQAIPDWLTTLFDGFSPLPIRHARELENQLAHADAGGLLLHRAELAQLLNEDPELLANVPLPIVVVA